jgi:hypothetical protein
VAKLTRAAWNYLRFVWKSDIRLPLLSRICGRRLKCGPIGFKTGPVGAKNSSKNYRKTENLFFHKNMFLDHFKCYLGGLGVFRGMASTIRTDFPEVWRDLVLHGMGEVDFHI